MSKEKKEKLVEKAEELSEEEGLAEGKIDVKAERNIEIAKSMLAKGMDINLISEVTGLNIYYIKNIK